LYLKSVASERKANEQSSLMTLNMANEANLQGNRMLGVLIAQEAMKNVSPKMEKYNKLEAQYENILNNSLITLPFSNQFILATESETEAFGISSDSEWLISSGSFNNAIIWNLENGILTDPDDYTNKKPAEILKDITDTISEKNKKYYKNIK